MMSNESSVSQISDSPPMPSSVDSFEPGTFDSLDPGSGYTMLESVLIAVIAGILSFLTIAGNVLVMVSFKLDKQLQTISNYFLLSLAGELYPLLSSLLLPHSSYTHTHTSLPLCLSDSLSD